MQKSINLLTLSASDTKVVNHLNHLIRLLFCISVTVLYLVNWHDHIFLDAMCLVHYISTRD